jgi:hypothetical protein
VAALVKPGVSLRKAGVSLPAAPMLFLFVLRGDLGSALEILALVALMKLELAALRKGVGRARNMRCE